MNELPGENHWKDLLELVSREIYISLSRLWRHVRHHIWPEHQVEHPKIFQNVPEAYRVHIATHCVYLFAYWTSIWGCERDVNKTHTVNHSHLRKPFSHTSQNIRPGGLHLLLQSLSSHCSAARSPETLSSLSKRRMRMCLEDPILPHRKPVNWVCLKIGYIPNEIAI